MNLKSIILAKVLGLSIIAIMVSGLTVYPAFATTVNFPDFSSTTGLTLNGNAAVVTNGIDPNLVLRLVPATTGQSGSMFSSTTINSADFSTNFQFRITNPGGVTDLSGEKGADGFVFVIQPVSSSHGGSGGGLGYAGITPSIGVEFDTFQNGFDPDTNHIGIDTNGNVDTNSQGSFIFIPQRFDSGDLYNAWIDYDGTTLKVFFSQTSIKPVTPALTKVINIPAIIGTINAFVGFTAGTGAAFGNHDIVNWIYFDKFIPTPPPTNPVGGEILPIDMTALFVAGAMTNAFWMIPTLGVIAGTALALFKIKRKQN